jgi:hypothetical protein
VMMDRTKNIAVIFSTASYKCVCFHFAKGFVNIPFFVLFQEMKPYCITPLTKKISLIAYPRITLSTISYIAKKMIPVTEV